MSRPPARAGHAAPRARSGALLAALLVLSAAPAPGAGAAAPLSAAQAAAPAFLVMPFENTADDPALGWLSFGLAQHTGDHLRGRGAVIVEEEDRSVFLEGQGLPPGGSLTLASALEVGRTMRARPAGVRPDHLVLGRFAVQDGGITLAARVIDLATESARPWITRDGRLKDLLEVHGSLADAIERETSLPRRRSDAIVEPPLLAFETYCRALAEGDSRKRLALLRRALQEFPGYPLAAYQAGALLVRGEQWREAAETLAAATSPAHPYEADFHLIEAAARLALNDPAAAERAARRSLGLAADSARAHALLGRARAAQGDLGAAGEELERAVAIDPHEPEIEDLRKALQAGGPTSGRTP